MRADAIKTFVRNLTQAWFQPPRGMDAATQADHAIEMAKAVDCAIPRSLHSDQVDDTLERAKSVLLKDAKSRAWPIIREVVAAIEKCLPGEAANATEAEKEDRRRGLQKDIARDWWEKFGDLPGWLSQDHVIEALIADGITARTLWRAGVDVPRYLRDWPEAAHWKHTPAYKRFGDGAVDAAG